MRLAVILAGGLGRRMEGAGPKPLTPLGDRSLIRHVAGRLAPQTDRLVVSWNGDAAGPGLDLPCVPDRRAGFPGPAEGLASAWERFGPAEAILCAPADTPFLPLDLFDALRAVLPEDGIAVARFAGRWQPTCALWSAASAGALAAMPAFAEGRSPSLRRLIEGFAHRPADFAPSPEAPDGDPFFNVNTREDLLRAQAVQAAGG